MEKIDTTANNQNGIEAARRRENEFHPKDPKTNKPLSAWDKRSHTLQLMVWDINELIDGEAVQNVAMVRLADRVTALEGRPQNPFPASGP